MALAFVLMIGAGLMVRPLFVLWRLDPGFNPSAVTTFSLAPRQNSVIEFSLQFDAGGLRLAYLVCGSPQACSRKRIADVARLGSRAGIPENFTDFIEARSFSHR